MTSFGRDNPLNERKIGLDLPKGARTTSERVALTMDHVGVDRDRIALNSQAAPMQLDAFLAGHGPMTPAIAFAISRATGSSAALWMEMAQQESGFAPASASSVGEKEALKSEALRDLLLTGDTLEVRIHAAQSLGAQLSRNPEIAAALLKVAQSSSEPDLFRASVEALAGYSVRSAEAVCESRLNGGALAIQGEALHTLYGLNPDAGVRRALDILQAAPSDATLVAASKEVLERYARITSDYARQSEEDTGRWLNRVEETLRSELARDEGSYEFRQPEGYEPRLLGAHMGVLFEEQESSLRQRSLMSLRTRIPELAELAAMLVTRDEDPVMRRTAVAVLHFIRSKVAKDTMEQLASDSDPSVARTAQALLAEQAKAS